MMVNTDASWTHSHLFFSLFLSFKGSRGWRRAAACHPSHRTNPFITQTGYQSPPSPSLFQQAQGSFYWKCMCVAGGEHSLHSQPGPCWNKDLKSAHRFPQFTNILKILILRKLFGRSRATERQTDAILPHHWLHHPNSKLYRENPHYSFHSS